MSKINKFEFLKEWFYKEEERKNSLNNSINIQLTILTAIIAVIYYCLSKFNYELNNFLFWIFLILISITILFWLISIYYLLKSYNNLYRGFKYNGFPKANFINEEYEKLEPYHKKYKKKLNKSLHHLVRDNIEQILIQSVDNNVYINDKKSAYLHKSKIHLLNCILSLLISTLLFSLNYIAYPKDKVTTIKTINDMSNKKPPPPPPPAQPRVIKESQIPKTPPPPRPKPKQ